MVVTFVVGMVLAVLLPVIIDHVYAVQGYRKDQNTIFYTLMIYIHDNGRFPNSKQVLYDEKYIIENVIGSRINYGLKVTSKIHLYKKNRKLIFNANSEIVYNTIDRFENYKISYGFNPTQATITDGKLIDKESGEEIFIIYDTEDKPSRGRIREFREISLRIHESIKQREQRGDGE